MKLNVMALTAGLGTRMAPHTNKLAKPAIPFLGVPLLLHALRPTESLVVSKLVVNLHHRPGDIQKVCERIKDRYFINYSDETAKILGSGGAITKAQQWLETEDHFLIVNGDEVFVPSTADFMATAYQHHISSRNLATLITMDHPEVGKKFGGVWCDQEHRVVQFSKKPVPETTGLHYTGYAFFSKRIFEYCTKPAIEENLLYDILGRALAAKEKIYAFKTVANWFETGNPVDFIRATERMIALYEKNPTSELSRNLAKFLRANQPWSVLVESGFSTTLSKVNKLLESIK